MYGAFKLSIGWTEEQVKQNLSGEDRTYHATKEKQRYSQIRMTKSNTDGYTRESNNAYHPEFREAIQGRHKVSAADPSAPF